MLRFVMLLCLCLFPFSGAWCEKQAAAESPGASALAIWGGNGDESLSSAYRTSEGDVVLLAQTDSTSAHPLFPRARRTGRETAGSCVFPAREN